MSKPSQDEGKKRLRLAKLSPQPIIYSAALATFALIIWAFRPSPITVDTGRATRGNWG